MHLSVLYIERHQFEPRQRQLRKRSPRCVLHVLDAGSVVLHMGRARYQLQAPAAWVTAPSRSSFSYTFGAEPSSKWYFGISGTSVASWEARGLLPREPFAIRDITILHDRVRGLRAVAGLQTGNTEKCTAAGLAHGRIPPRSRR